MLSGSLIQENLCLRLSLLLGIKADEPCSGTKNCILSLGPLVFSVRMQQRGEKPLKVLHVASSWAMGNCRILQSFLRVQSTRLPLLSFPLTIAHGDKTRHHVFLPLGVVVQLALYRLAAFNGKNSLGFWEEDEIPSNLIRDVQIRLVSPDFHLSHGTLDHMMVLQRQKWDEEVHQVLIDQTRVPQST